MNDRTGELLGALADISPKGFRLESSKPIPANADFPIRIDVPGDVAEKSYMVFSARSKWSMQHPVDRSLYQAGFEIVEMDAGDSRTFELIFDRYGTAPANKDSTIDYLWGK